MCWHGRMSKKYWKKKQVSEERVQKTTSRREVWQPYSYATQSSLRRNLLHSFLTASIATPLDPLHVHTQAHSPPWLLPSNIKPSLLHPTRGSSNRQPLIKASPSLAGTFSELPCSWKLFLADLSSSLSPFTGLRPAVGLEVLSAYSCSLLPLYFTMLSQKISCTSISALLSSTWRIQTGPQRHTQLLRVINLELVWGKRSK